MNFAASKIPLNIKGPTITGGPGTNVSSAASAVNLANIWADNRRGAVDFGAIAQEAMINKAALENTITATNADLKATATAVKGGIERAEIEGENIRNTAKEEKETSFLQDGLKLAGTVATTALLAGCDETIKDNIQNIEDALSTLRQLRPVTFNYKEEWSTSPERLHHGFIAQEYKEVMPDATYYDEEYEKYCIDTAELIGLLVRAVQQLETKVTRLEAANALEGVKS